MHLLSLIPWFLLVAVLVGMGLLESVRHGRRKKLAAERAQNSAATAPQPDDRSLFRSYALDALGDAVLITDREGRVRDCNSSALTLFDRHRAIIESQSAGVLRRFEGIEQTTPQRVASEHAVWQGEAWARQPDGGMKLCLSRVIAIRDQRLRVTGFVESFRDVSTERNWSEEFRDLLYGVRSFQPETPASHESLQAVQEEVRQLSEAFRDLDLVIRQYERLLPSLGADDPLTESIAGAAHDARTAVAAVGVPTLLEEIPRTLARLRAHLQMISLDANVPGPSEAQETPAESGRLL